MNRFKKILLYWNPQVRQDAAIRRALSLAKHNAAKLTILSVIREPPGGLRVSVTGARLKDIQLQVVQERQAELDALAGDFRREGVDARACVATGVEFLEVVREVLRAGHDLVILAADGKRSYITRLFGSTTMNLMRKCPCPVWVIKPGSARSSKRILAAVDVAGDPWDDTKQSINPLILELASSLARIEKSDLHVVQVWSVAFEGYLNSRGNLSEHTVNKEREEAQRDYARRLDQLMEETGLSGIKSVHTHLKQGDQPAATIIKLARTEKIDLLVMGTVCRTGLAGFFIGNTAEEVLSAVDCSVLTVKPAGFISPVVPANR